MSELKDLLETVDTMFPKIPHNKIATFSYSLNRTQHGLWRFTVTDNWYNWSDKNLQHQFGEYEQPETAVFAFIKYVENNNIDVSSLCETNE